MRRTETEINRIMIEARVRALNVQPDTPWWYLSFAGDDGFHGACIVQGYDMAVAIARSHLLKINPGGQVMAFPHGEIVAPPEKRNLLLGLEELEALGGGKKIKDMTEEELAHIGLGSDIAPLRTALQAQTADARKQSTSHPEAKGIE